MALGVAWGSTVTGLGRARRGKVLPGDLWRRKCIPSASQTRRAPLRCGGSQAPADLLRQPGGREEEQGFVQIRLGAQLRSRELAHHEHLRRHFFAAPLVRIAHITVTRGSVSGKRLFMTIRFPSVRFSLDRIC